MVDSGTETNSDLCQLKNLFDFPDDEVHLNRSFPSEKVTSDTTPFSIRRKVLTEITKKKKITLISKSASVSISSLILMKSIAGMKDRQFLR